MTSKTDEVRAQLAKDLLEIELEYIRQLQTCLDVSMRRFAFSLCASVLRVFVVNFFC